MGRCLSFFGFLMLCGAVAHAQPDSLSGRIDRLNAAVVVSGSKAERLVRPQTGLESMNPGIVRRIPAFLGEPDILKAIQLLPGVQSPSDGSAGFSVRGGQVDQNLILLDGAPVYCSGHVFGFLSMFNGDVLGRTEIYKGDFPARFGGRISSVLEASTRDGNMERHGGSLTIGLAASKIHLAGPIVPGKLSYSVSGRRSLIDMVLPFIRGFPAGNTLRFYDVNAKLSWIASPRDRLSLNAFLGGDKIGATLKQYGLNLSEFTYDNRAFSLRWRHDFSPVLQSSVTLYHSRFLLGTHANYNYAVFDYHSFVRESGLRAELVWQAGEHNRLEAGFQLPYFRLNTGDFVPGAGNITIKETHIAPNFAIQPNLYVENTTTLGPVTFRYGLHLSEYTSLGETDQRYYDPVTHKETQVRHFGSGEPIQTYWGLEPRASLSVRLGKAASLKAAYSRTEQYFQQALVSTSGSPLDVWIAASPTVKPQVSDQFSVGYYHLFLHEAAEVSLELFYKNNRNTVDFKDNPGTLLDREDREAFLRFGRSFSYGVEFMFRYESGPWCGWLGYTWSKAIYDIPEVNGGKPYASSVNHEHNVDLFLSYDISPKLTVSACWVYASGAPTTYPVARYAIGGAYAPVFGGRNEGRLPDYHRLDLSLTLKTRSGSWDFSLYNAYSRHNAWSVTYSYSQVDDKPRASMLYLFPILPSVSYTFRF